MALRVRSLPAFLRSSKPYSLYVLFMLMLVYLFNQMDRFVLGIASKNIAEDLDFAHYACFPNSSAAAELPGNASCVGACMNIKNETDCTISGEVDCQWDISATGLEYEVLAGPAFTLVFTLAAIPLGVLASHDKVNRKVGIAVCFFFWSAMTLLSGFTKTFWQLLLTRIGLGIFEAVCTPFASSIISDYFEESFRATALGFYNWGIYIGYSLAFAFNFILLATGWRWAFRIAAFPGFILSVVMLVTVREPVRKSNKENEPYSKSSAPLLKRVLRSYFSPSLLLLCVAGGIRQGGGLVWSYNVKAYFNQYYCNSVNVGDYLSWVPLVGGTIGALVGGFLSDRLVKSRGSNTRLWVLIISQVAASPFVVGAIFLPPTPWAFLSLLPAYVVGEVWIGVCLAVVIDLVPIDVTSAAVALYLFIINNIGSTMTLLVPLISSHIGLRYTLLILFPGSYILAAGLFGVTFGVQVCKERGWQVCCCRRRGSEPAVLRECSPLIQAEGDSDDDDEIEEGEVSIILPEFKRTQQRKSRNRTSGARNELTESYDIYIM